MKNKKEKIRFIIFLNFALLILDRLSKWIILDCGSLLHKKLVELELLKNKGLFFIPEHHFTQPKFILFNQIALYLLISLLITILLFFFFQSWKKGNVFLMAGFSLTIFGGLSNLFDRLFFGYVIDWIRIFILPFSVFNLADIMIFSGVILIIINFWKYKKLEF